MFKKKTIGILIISSFFLACTSIVDTTILLSNSFKKESRVISLDSPTWRLKDSVYNKKLGNYFIANSKTTGEYLKEELTNSRIEGNFIHNFLFYGKLYHIIKEFKQEGNQRFSFELKQDRELKATSKCEIFTKSLLEEGSTIREKTFLVCSITVANQHWGLTLKSYKNEPIVVKLNSTNSSYLVKEISKHQDILSNGERRNVPSYLSLHSGLEFYKNNKQVTALSFFKKTKIWIRNGLSTDEEVLLLSANYSLIMFNWLDREW